MGEIKLFQELLTAIKNGKKERKTVNKRGGGGEDFAFKRDKSNMLQQQSIQRAFIFSFHSKFFISSPLCLLTNENEFSLSP